MITFRMQVLSFYALPLAYVFLAFFSHVGDIQHGGTVRGWLGLQALAVVILFGVLVLFPQVNKTEKGILLLCAVFPLIGLMHTVMSYVHL